MSAPAYMLSLLSRQRQLLGDRFKERYPSNWLVWEPGPWRPARSELTSNTEATQLPTPMPFARPVGDDALCFELKRVVSSLMMGRGSENHIVVNDLTVSRAQLHLEFANEQWRVRTNSAVTVDGQSVGTHGLPLKNASVIVIGDVRMTFYEPDGFLQRLQQPQGGKTAAAAGPSSTTTR
ncbi:MAG: FHA domain-containing protein [Archangium sp.]|nr:FHA domain-containing protein [Archangium sp.]